MKRFKKALFFSVLFVLLFFISPVHAATFCVNTATKLADALYYAETNTEDDVIKLVQGTYRGNFSYNNSATDSLSIDGGYTTGCASRQLVPSKTVLDGGGDNNVLNLVTTNNAIFKVSNLTVQNGGNGLYISTNNTTSSKVTLVNVRVIDNDLGIFIESKSVAVINNKVDNKARGGKGISIHASGSVILQKSVLTNNYESINIDAKTLFLKNNTFKNNDGGFYSSIVSISADTATISYNQFYSNTTSPFASGFSVTTSKNFFMDHNVFEKNDNRGLMLEINAPSVVFNNNTLTRNSSCGVLQACGSVYFLGSCPTPQGSTQTFTNNVIADNSIINNGVCNNVNLSGAETISLFNNTITGNKSTGDNDDSGIIVKLGDNSHKALIYNNIIWDNQSILNRDIYINNDGNNDSIRSPVTLLNNNFSGIEFSLYIPTHTSNRDTNPLFIDASHLNYHLRATSPLIDKGNNNAPGLPIDDLDGDTRIIGTKVDIGADEFKP